MREITLEELLEAGCHFGHQVTRGNPKARDYIFEARDNIHIIDLVKTKKGLEETGRFVYELASRNGSLVVLGTKRQAQGIVDEEVKRAKHQVSGKTENRIFHVINRWIGGTFTNFSEVSKNFKKLKDLTQKLKDEEEKAKYTKKEVGLWEKERQKLERLYGGIADLDKIPDAIFIIDSHLENLSALEAKKMGVATLGITDTNADPTIIDYPIPANDDATGSIKIITKYIIDAWIEGRKKSSVSASQPVSLKGNVHGQETKPKTDIKRVAITKPKIKTTKKKEENEKHKLRTRKKTT